MKKEDEEEEDWFGNQVPVRPKRRKASMDLTLEKEVDKEEEKEEKQEIDEEDEFSSFDSSGEYEDEDEEDEITDIARVIKEFD